MAKTATTFIMPKGACNAHLHIIDPAFPNDGNAEVHIGTVEMYKKVAERFGLERAVFVQAKDFGLDNTCTIDAVKKFGIDKAVGIGVVNNNVTDQELEYMNANGIKGLRFSVWNPNNAVVSFDDCLPLSKRVYDMGWNMQLHMSSKQLLDRIEIIKQIPGKIVIDHVGRMQPALGVNDPAFKEMLKLVDRGNTWVKLSGSYLNTTEGYPWNDATKTALAMAEYAPERVVWGSDFPHVTEKVAWDESVFVETIPLWLKSNKARQLALVTNPEELYGFKPL